MRDRETMRLCNHSFEELYPRCKICGFDAMTDQDIYTRQDNKDRSKCEHEWETFYWETGSYYASTGHECTICAKCYKLYSNNIAKFVAIISGLVGITMTLLVILGAIPIL